MKGEWGNHPQYGEQFKFSFCQTTVPASVNGIEKYLGSGLIKGIGPVMANELLRCSKKILLILLKTRLIN